VIGNVTVRAASVPVPVGASRRIARACEGSERAISAGASWSHDDTTKLLYISELRPQLNPQNQVTGFLAWGRNGTGASQEESILTVHVLCYTP
jgi:hypothetical protein